MYYFIFLSNVNVIVDGVMSFCISSEIQFRSEKRITKGSIADKLGDFIGKAYIQYNARWSRIIS